MGKNQKGLSDRCLMLLNCCFVLRCAEWYCLACYVVLTRCYGYLTDVEPPFLGSLELLDRERLRGVDVKIVY